MNIDRILFVTWKPLNTSYLKDTDGFWDGKPCKKQEKKLSKEADIKKTQLL